MLPANKPYRGFLGIGVVLVALVALACGASATSTPRPSATATPRPPATSVPAATAMAPAAATAAPLATSRPGPTSRPVATVRPTPTRAAAATPRPTTAPAMAAKPKVDRVVFALIPPPNENNWTWLQSGRSYIQNLPYMEYLIGLDPSGRFIPKLATSWEVNPAADTWTFTLREGVPFHFGWGDFNAEDVVRSHFLITQPDHAGGGAMRYLNNTISKVEAIDSKTAVFRLVVGDANLDWFSGPGGALFIQNAAQWDREGKAGLESKPAGTGPYQYVKRVDGRSLSFEIQANKYWGQAPEFKFIEMRWVTESATRLAMILAGEVHITQLPNDLEEAAMGRGLERLVGGFPNQSFAMLFGGLYFLDADKFDPSVSWANVKVREAINRSIDRKELLNAIYGDKAIRAANHFYWPSTSGYNPQWEADFESKYGYDPDKARALLAEAGLSNFKVRLALYNAPGAPQVAQLTEALSIYFKRVGADAELVQIDYAAFRKARGGRTLTGLIFAQGSANAPVQFNLGNYYDSSSRGVVGAYQSQYIQERYEKLVNSIDTAERARLSREIGDHVFNEYAVIPLALIFTSVVSDPEVVGSWGFSGLGVHGGLDNFELLRQAR